MPPFGNRGLAPSEDSTISKLMGIGLGITNMIAGKKVANNVEDLGFDILEKFSRVATFAKKGAVKSFENPIGRSLLPIVPERARALLLTSSDVERLMMEYDTVETYLSRHSTEFARRYNSATASPPSIDRDYDFENLKQDYVPQFTGTSLTKEVWESWFDSEGKLTKSEKFIKLQIFSGVYKFLFRESNQGCGMRSGDLYWKFMTGNRMQMNDLKLEG